MKPATPGTVIADMHGRNFGTHARLWRAVNPETAERLPRKPTALYEIRNCVEWYAIDDEDRSFPALLRKVAKTFDKQYVNKELLVIGEATGRAGQDGWMAAAYSYDGTLYGVCEVRDLK